MLMRSRAKTKDTGVWIEGYYACESNHACFANEHKYTHFIFRDEFLDWSIGGLVQYEVIGQTVGRSTGLFDKNLKEIFEGDILEHHVQSDRIVNRGVVNWDKTNARWAFQLNTMNSSFSLFDREAWVVIGNIHDNPELIKGE